MLKRGSSCHFRAAAGVLCVAAAAVQAQPIAVPNRSFESQTAPSVYPFVNLNVDSWQKNPEPAFYQAFASYGVPWEGTAGVFLDVNPYANKLGNQVGYLLAVPQVALFQDHTTGFDATFEPGKAYNLTVGVFGKSSIAPGSTLEISLYYRDGSNNKVTVGSTAVTYSAAAFPATSPLSLVDYSVNVPLVQASDAWAGQQIGIQVQSSIPIEMTSFGNWDFDNVRLTAVPEPATGGILGLGIAGLALVRRGARRGGRALRA